MLQSTLFVFLLCGATMSDSAVSSYEETLEECDDDCEKYEALALKAVQMAFNPCKASGKIATSLGIGAKVGALCTAVFNALALKICTWAAPMVTTMIVNTTCKQIVNMDKNLSESVKNNKLVMFAHEIAVKVSPVCLSEQEKATKFGEVAANQLLADGTLCRKCLAPDDEKFFKSCRRCRNPHSWWYGTLIQQQKCGTEPKWENGRRCALGTTCRACENKATFWVTKAFTACGTEILSDGTRCALGTTCKKCKNSPTMWYSKLFTACGTEPGFPDGTSCFPGTSCRRCRNTATWWNGDRPGHKCGKEPCWRRGKSCRFNCRQCCNGYNRNRWTGKGTCK